MEIANILYINNSGSIDGLTAKTTHYLCYLNNLKISIVYDDNSDTLPEILSEAINAKFSDIIENSSINNTTVHNISENNIRTDSDITKIEIPQLLVPETVYTPVIKFSDIQSVIAIFDGTTIHSKM